MTQPFALVEKALRELIEAEYEPARGNTGGDPSYVEGQALFVWIALVPGGSTDQIYGEWVVDIDCIAPTYGAAMQAALDLEAILVGPRHVTTVMRLDNCVQNEGPAQRPWDDDTVYRIGATYVFTARRSG